MLAGVLADLGELRPARLLLEKAAAGTDGHCIRRTPISGDARLCLLERVRRGGVGAAAAAGDGDGDGAALAPAPAYPVPLPPRPPRSCSLFSFFWPASC